MVDFSVLRAVRYATSLKLIHILYLTAQNRGANAAFYQHFVLIGTENGYFNPSFAYIQNAKIILFFNGSLMLFHMINE